MQELCTEWINTLNDMKSKSDEVKSLKTKHEALTNNIISLMQENNTETIQVNDNKKIVMKEHTTFSTINKAYILEVLKPFYEDTNIAKTQLAEKTTDVLLNNRTPKTKYVLKCMKGS